MHILACKAGDQLEIHFVFYVSWTEKGKTPNCYISNPTSAYLYVFNFKHVSSAGIKTPAEVFAGSKPKAENWDLRFLGFYSWLLRAPFAMF